MSWNMVYLIGGIVTFIIGIWSLAKRRDTFLAITGILWFFVVLFYFFVGNVYKTVLISGMPPLGNLLHFVALPVFLILSFVKK